MNIAIFHNFMDNIGGAEIVTLTLARELHADIYTTNINPEHIREMGFTDVLPRIKSIGKIPLNAPFRQQTAFYRFGRLNLHKQKIRDLYNVRHAYDFFIISGDWAMSGANHNSPNLWYVHSPLHELWAFKDQIRSTMISPWKRPIYDLWVWFNRKLTLKYAEHVDTFIANSLNTRERISLYYKKESIVINPPIYTNKYGTNLNIEDFATIEVSGAQDTSKDYWLSVNRLVSHKRIEMQTDAFKDIPSENLIIVGSYEKDSKHFETYKDRIEKSATKNVRILNWVPDTKLRNLYANCKGFITTSKAEDFGMTAIEAMASGKPVIAPADGGYKETIIHGETGILIEEINSQKLLTSVHEINEQLALDPKKYAAKCINQAKKFDTAIFIEKIKATINQILNRK